MYVNHIILRTGILICLVSCSENLDDRATPADVSSINCDRIPPLPIRDVTEFEAAPGAEDFTFDNEGYLVGVTGDNELFRLSYSGVLEVLHPNLGIAMDSAFPVRGIRFLHNGDLVYVDRGIGGLVRMTMNNYFKQPIISGLKEPNGIAIDSNEFVYLTELGGRVIKVDPNNGESRVLQSENVALDGIAFSPDFHRLYYNSEDGQLFYLPIFDDGTVGNREFLVQLTEPQSGSESNHLDDGVRDTSVLLDGMTVDECGNIYVVQMKGIIWKVSPEGEKEIVVDLAESRFSGIINAVNFGSGIGGWKSDAIYIIAMSGGLFEVEVGVRGRSNIGTAVAH